MARLSAAYYFYLAIHFLAASLVVVHGDTNPADVNALINLYSAFGWPLQLTNWNINGGDPCAQNWLGVVCSASNVTEIHLSNLGLNGSLGYSLDEFHGLLVFDVSQNNLGRNWGSIPYQLPPNVQQLNLGNNQFSGSFPYSVQRLFSLTNLNLNHNQLENNIPDIFANLTKLQTLDLSFNNFTGALPSSLGDLSALTVLNVQNNLLSGSLPSSLSNLTNLQTLNVQDNKFTGWIPSGLNPPNLLTSGNAFSSPGQPHPPSHDTPQAGQSDSSNRESGSHNLWTGAEIGGITAISLLVPVPLILLGLLYFRWRKHEEKIVYEKKGGWGPWFLHFISPVEQAEPLDDKILDWPGRDYPPSKTSANASTSFKTTTDNRDAGIDIASKSPKTSIAATAYSLADLQAATNSFAQEHLVGEGSLGCVYNGDFQDGQVLAVKKLDTSAPLVQSEPNFLRVVGNIARLRHANIIELVGYCAEHGQRLLVYEYVSHGTLSEILHGNEDEVKCLSWNARVKIALGAARALEYLHEVCIPAVVHRNFKSGNILLDNQLNPHLSDCGIADLSSHVSNRQVSPHMLGSFGYSAPESAMSGVYTMKSDVYSFGIVMLELLTGCKPLDSSRPKPEQSLVGWAAPQLHNIDALTKMVDPALNGNYPAKSLCRFADIIAFCVQPEPEFRPPMSEIVQALVRMMQRPSFRSGDNLGAANQGLDRCDTSIIYRP
ncbi:hypothetical protein CY35_19G024200 [Sphagnum magellanicum]|jgi:hypothetical protein|nr:hypothetical protein CY35_19G024200 [Sphagnum magellanicum]